MGVGLGVVGKQIVALSVVVEKVGVLGVVGCGVALGCGLTVDLSVVVLSVADWYVALG